MRMAEPAASRKAVSASDLANSCAFAVMAKAPRPGEVKTRLVLPLLFEEAAALSEKRQCARLGCPFAARPGGSVPRARAARDRAFGAAPDRTWL